MSDKMIPIPFEKMLTGLIKEYKEKKSFMDVPVTRQTGESYANDIGPAAGPHTQLAGNILAAYAAGATYFELKTVQVITGEGLGIQKPCIYAATEVFNTEWSTELSIEEAKNEYIKAYLLLKILIKELGLGSPERFEFIMSVGYDLRGIQSQVIDDFINHMKDASRSREWREDMAFLNENIGLFDCVTAEYLAGLSPVVSHTMALSTMHGCQKDEIEQMAHFLLKEKDLHVYVKMNPTLLGRDQIRHILDHLGYTHLTFDEAIFDLDIDFENACDMLARLQEVGVKCGRTFGVKLTNTLPVTILRDELLGETMYLSGPALYPMAIQVAKKISEVFGGKLPISFSGGAEPNNVRQILETGIRPITVSSYLLKPSGYKNLDKLVNQVDGLVVPAAIDQDKLDHLAMVALEDTAYAYSPKVVFSKSDAYSPICAACNHCLDICPNRANRLFWVDGKRVIVRIDELCNACGACSHYCIKGHDPYEEKLALLTSKIAFEAHHGPSFYWCKGSIETKETTPAIDETIKKIPWEEYIS